MLNDSSPNLLDFQNKFISVLFIMPRVKNSTNLEDYSRTRQWQLKKQFANINTRRYEIKDPSNDCSERFEVHPNAVTESGEFPYNEPMQGVEVEEAVNEVFQENDVLRSTVQTEDEETEEAVDELTLDVNPLEDITEHGEEDAEDDDGENESDIENESDMENGNDDEYASFDEHNNRWEDDADEPLYDGASISVSETMVAILTFVSKFNLTGSCLSALLKLIALIIPTTPRFRRTAYKFHKFFNNMKSPLVRHHYCSACHTLIENDQDRCNCSATNGISYFLQIPIIDQLQSLLSRPHFWNDLNQRPETESSTVISDIYHGEVYKNHSNGNGLLAKKNHNISFMFYTDGAPAFKSSKCKVWPVYLIINELPYSQRILKENTIVSGIWFGPENPNSNLFLQPLHTEMVKLRRGVYFKIPQFTTPKKLKALLICGTCDIPAKADFMNHSHHNGFYGCTLCYSPGYNISGANFGNTHIYPFDGPLKLRTVNEHRQNVVDAYREGERVFGVKEPSLLHSIMPNAINGMSIDVMHCVFNGIVPKLVFLWFDTTLRFEKFSLYARKAIVDNRLLQIQPISSVSRLPRSISDTFSHWKASEWRNFLFYYSIPILQDIMDDKYFEHYTQVVQGIYMLSMNSISPEQIDQAEKLLICFVSNFQALYNARFMSINIHLLMHLVESVRNTGPTWVTTCFPFEDLNGKLLKYIHGTSHVGLQIGSSVAYSIIISNIVATLNNDSEIKKYCSDLSITGKRLKQTQQICERTYIVGKITRVNHVPQHLRRILEESGFRDPGLKISTFRGIKKNGHIIYNINYKRSRLYAFYAIVYREHNSTGMKIGFIESFFKLCVCIDECQPDFCEARYIAIVKDGSIYNQFSTSCNMIINNNVDDTHYDRISVPHIHRFRENNHRKLILISNIKSVCFTLKVNQEVYIGELINDIDFKGAD